MKGLLAAHTENFIAERDKLWVRVANLSGPVAADVDQLRVVNESLREMLRLTPGPTTPVMPAMEARIQMLRVNICAVFITRLDIEIRGYNSRPSGMTVPDIMNEPRPLYAS